MQLKRNIFLIVLIMNTLGLITSLTAQAQEKALAEADSLFRYRKYAEAFDKYAQIWEKEKQYTPAMLLKMAFVKEDREEYPEALLYLNQYYLRNPDPRVWQKIGELAEKYKLQGYQSNDLEYLVILYQKNQVIFNLLFLSIFLLGLANLLWRWWRGKDILYRVIVFNVLTIAYIWLFNYGMRYQKGIVRTDRVLLMNAPSAGAKLLSTSEKGNCMAILGEKDIWYKVRFWHREEWTEGYVRKNNLYLVEK